HAHPSMLDACDLEPDGAESRDLGSDVRFGAHAVMCDRAANDPVAGREALADLFEEPADRGNSLLRLKFHGRPASAEASKGDGADSQRNLPADVPGASAEECLPDAELSPQGRENPRVGHGSRA